MAACTLHSIVGCAQCAGTMTAEDRWYLHLGAVAGTGTVAEGTVRKRYTVPPQHYLRPLYDQQWRAQRTPPPPTEAFGTDGTALATLNSKAGRYDGKGVRAHWTQHDGKATAKPKRLPGGASPDTVEWAKRLGVEL